MEIALLVFVYLTALIFDFGAHVRRGERGVIATYLVLTLISIVVFTIHFTNHEYSFFGKIIKALELIR